jgi:hypothetical protein
MNVVSNRNRANSHLSAGGFPILRSGTQRPYKRSRAFFKFRMIFQFPAACGLIERAQQFLPANFTFHNLGEERAALSLPKELINVAEQTFRQEDMGALLYHSLTPLVVGPAYCS